MSTRTLFNRAFAVHRNYGSPLELAIELNIEHHSLYRAAGFCAAQQEQRFTGWVNEQRWMEWVRRMEGWSERQDAITQQR